MSETIKKRALRYARHYPGQSATQIANALRASVSTVSSVLYLACQAGVLTRSDRVTGGGPGGGHVYGPVKP